TFRTEDEDFLTTDDPDFHPSDVIEDADGSLLVIDTGSWYVDHCPTGRIRRTQAKGEILRVRYSQAMRHTDPRGLKFDWDRMSFERLVPFLGDSSPAIRDRAEETLLKQGEAAGG